MGNGMAVFYVQAIGHLPICMLWNCNGASHGECQGWALWVLQWDVPMGSPWNYIGKSLCEFHGLVLWVMHLDYLLWAFYGIALGVLMGKGMALFYVQSNGHLPICM